MNIDRPHEIERFEAPPAKPAPENGSRRWIQLTEPEAVELQGKSENERAGWLAALPTTEYVARVLEYSGLPQLAARARAGEFDDFKSTRKAPLGVLEQELTDRCRFDLRRRLRAGEFTATMRECQAWQEAQTGSATLGRELLERRNRL